MRSTSRLVGVVTTIVWVAGLTTGMAAVAAESATETANGWTQKTAHGQPDLQGIWRTMGVAIYTYDIQDPAPERAYRGAGERLKKTFKPIIVDPPDGRVPYQPWAAQKRAQLYEAAFDPQHLQELDPQAFCVRNGPPRSMYHLFVQIYQFSDYVVIVNEFSSSYRVIPLDGRPHIPEAIKLFVGDARGRWEGDSLVVDVKNNNGRNWLSVAGDIHSDRLVVQERFTRTGPDSLVYEATLDDPVVYTRPWKMRIDLRGPPDPNYEFLEYACHEGNASFSYTKLKEEAAAK